MTIIIPIPTIEQIMFSGIIGFVIGWIGRWVWEKCMDKG